MTDSIDEKPTPRQPRIDPQNESFDFDLAEVQVIPDQVNPAPGSLDQATPNENNVSFSGNESLIPPAKTVPEIKTNFYVDYFDKRKKVKTTNAKPPLSADEANKPSSVDDQSQDSMTAENLPPQTEQSPDNQAPNNAEPKPAT